MSDPHNRGEATLLIIGLLKILKNGQIDLLEAMKQDRALLDQATQIVKAQDVSDQARDVLFIYFQQAIFGTDLEKISDNQLREQLDISRYRMTQILNELEAKKLIREVNKRPKAHDLNQELEDELFDR